MKPAKQTKHSSPEPTAWTPDWKWHIKTLAIIYVALTAAFFIISHFLKKLPPPYHMRNIPHEATPWLNPKK
ncbi:MAG: hypothetical protein NTW04_01015 [Elusimicrobia bacterium]|nr:hypothetical protein [Elusimicrobiota bacterium]